MFLPQFVIFLMWCIFVLEPTAELSCVNNGFCIVLSEPEEKNLRPDRILYLLFLHEVIAKFPPLLNKFLNR